MRVMALLHAYVPQHGAGAEWMAHTMLRHLVAEGHDVDVQLSNRALIRDDYTVDGVRVHALRDRNDPVRMLAGPPRPDVLVTHLENTARASILARQAAVPVVHICHNTLPYSKKWARDLRPALLVVNSQWMADDFAADFAEHNRPLPRTEIIRPPVAVADYATTPGDRVTLVNLFPSKGSATFWALARRMPDVPFLAVRGGYGDQEIPDTLPGNVDLVDNTPNIRDDVYARTRILLMPSFYESWGRVGVEAMCSGIPVIAHPTPGLRESLGDAGTFVDRDDVDGWETAIRALLKPRAWARASKSAKARAAELDPTDDLARWTAAMVDVAAHRSKPRTPVTLPRLRNTTSGVVVSCEGDKAARLLSSGWEMAG